MKILQIFGAVVAVHLLAFIFIFASPGCQSGPRNIPTPDATVPSGSNAAPLAYDSGATTATPVDLSVPASSPVSYTPVSAGGHAAPTRPGSAAAVAITPVKQVAEVAPTTSYTIAKGDSLWTVAKKNGLTVAELAKVNNLSVSATLQPGRKLLIPGKVGTAPKDLGTTAPATAATKAASEKTAPERAEPVKHAVVAGETLGSIAKKYQIKTAELVAANNLSSPMIRVGQILVIPGFKAVGAKSGGTAAKPAGGTTSASAPTVETTPAVKTPHFELTPPPQG